MNREEAIKVLSSYDVNWMSAVFAYREVEDGERSEE